MENPVSEDASSKGEWQVSMVPPGSSQDRGMCEEKRTDDRPAEGGTLNSGGPESEPEDAGRHPKADCDQPQEDAVWTLRESDPPIVVRDGNTGHMAKERAGSNASKALTSGHVDPDNGVTLPVCIGNRFWHTVLELVSFARFLRSPVR
jgi:hypothetical protein